MYNAAEQIVMINLIIWAVKQREVSAGAYGLALTAGGAGGLIGTPSSPFGSPTSLACGGGPSSPPVPKPGDHGRCAWRQGRRFTIGTADGPLTPGLAYWNR